MAKRNCDVCGGSGWIRMPLTMSVMDVVPSTGPSKVMAMEKASYRDYHCPECTAPTGRLCETVPVERVEFVQYADMFEPHIDDADYLEHMRNIAARGIVDFLLKGGFIDVAIGEIDKDKRARPVAATLGVISTEHVATLKERIAQHQELVAEEVVAEALRRIRNWGSHYTGDEGPIDKATARREVSDALVAVMRKRTPKEQE